MGISFTNCTIGAIHLTETLKDLDLNASAEDFSKKVNKDQSVWSIWIDRDFVSFNQGSIENPWG